MKSERITVKEHYDKLEDVTLKLILYDRTSSFNLNVRCYTFTSVLCRAFSWKHTMEGTAFWVAFSRRAQRMEGEHCVYEKLNYMDFKKFLRYEYKKND